MKVEVSSYRAVAYWIWDVSDEPHKLYHYAPPDEAGIDDDDDQDVCGICQAAFESTCPDCKIPGDDCPLSKCTVCGAQKLNADFLLFSLGGMHPRLSHALPAEVDRPEGGRITTAMSYGQKTLG